MTIKKKKSSFWSQAQGCFDVFGELHKFPLFTFSKH